MSDKFTVIESTDEDKSKEMDRVYRIARLNELWERQYLSALEKACTGKSCTIKDLPQDELAKVGFAGIKYICSMREVTRESIKLGINRKRQIIMRSDIKLPQPFASWSNSLSFTCDF